MVAYGEHVAQRWWSEMSPRGFPIGTCREGTAPAEKGPSRVESRRAGDEAERTRVWVGGGLWFIRRPHGDDLDSTRLFVLDAAKPRSTSV